jgi:phosphoglycerate dehydrogenase-like enzyme
MKKRAINIVIGFDGIAAAEWQRVHALSGEGHVRYVEEHPQGWAGLLEGAEVVFGWPDPAALAASNVRFHQLPSSGYDQYRTTQILKKAPLQLANARGVVARAVAEHALAWMLAFNRNLPQHWTAQQQARWERASRYSLLRGQTLAIVGMGAIGRELAKLGKALGMRVLAINRSPVTAKEIEHCYSLEEIDRALPMADHVALTLGANPDLPPLMDAPRLARMKPTAFFYNLARGSLLDDAALTEALRDGRIAGAGLDVFATEPLPPSSPLWTMPGTQITPHAGGRFDGENAALTSLFLDNLTRYRSGAPLLNVVIGKDTNDPAH